MKCNASDGNGNIHSTILSKEQVLYVKIKMLSVKRVNLLCFRAEGNR